MKFSVIIPLYNKAPYIRKALESVFAQTYTDYELIIVDDGSTDGSAEIAEAILQKATRLQGYEAKGMEDEVKGERLEAKGMENGEADIQASTPYTLHSTPTDASRLSGVPENACGDLGCSSPLAFRLRLLEQPNQGVSAARNTGVVASTGDYVAFLDADDWWEPTYLERMAQLIEDYPDAGLYACNYYYHKDGVNIIKVDIPTGYFNYPKEYFKNFAMPVTSISVVIPRKVFSDIGGFPIGIKLGEDFLLWAKIALQYKVAFLNEPLAYYNNTLPPNYRATYHLHKPEEHMLFRLELVFGDEGMRRLGERREAKGTESSEANIPASNLSPLTSNLKSDWKSLLDMLRLLGLHSYWLSNEYHDIAQREIDKVDMSQQYEFLINLYRKPRWEQQFKQRLLQMGAGLITLLKRFKQKKKMVQANTIITNKEYRRSMGLPL